MTETAERIVLASRPVGEPTLDNFRLEEFPIPQPGPGQMLLRTLWLSLDPYMRGRMSDAPSYAKPVGIGEVMEGGTVSEVVASNVPRFAKRDIVVGRTGWQTYALSDGSSLQKVDPTRAPIQTALGVLGMPGMTAYMGLIEIGKPATGETVVVAAASGAVGSVVGQIARIKGARAVGIAGGPDKCRYVTEELGFDSCIDHRAPDFAARLVTACPKGIDVYFENVGGAVFEAVLPLLNPFARILVCGLISMYNATSLSPGPILLPHLMRAILTKRLTLRGFIVSDFIGRYGDFMHDVSTWVREGQIKYREDVVEGLKSAPRAFIGLLRGENFGKLLVRVAHAYLPHSVGPEEKRYNSGVKEEIERAKTRFLRIIAEEDPQKVFVFSNDERTAKGWPTLPPTREEETSGSLHQLGAKFPRFSWGTYQTGSGHIVMAFGLRHPQGANGMLMRRAVVRAAGLGAEVTPHVLRHTCATWLMQKGVNLWDAAGFLGMSVQQLEQGYGHHHPDYQEDAVAALGGQYGARNSVNKARRTDANVTKIDAISKGG